MRLLPLALLAALTLSAPAQQADRNLAFAQSLSDAPGTTQTERDEYTRYELGAPDSHSFLILYDVTATRPGARFFYNPIRKGSVASNESVTDSSTGKPLVFAIVPGTEAQQDPLMAQADPATDYIRVTLAHPIPLGGQARVHITKTYTDPRSYFAEGQKITFKRGLGIPRNTVVLPLGYAAVLCTVPSQLLTEADGRLAVSFLHAGSGEAPLTLEATPTAQQTRPRPATKARSWESPFQGPTESTRLSQRAGADRDITYFLEAPETSSFALFHDYTETRPLIAHYLNVVRAGSQVSDPWAYVLDTGQRLTPTIMKAANLPKSYAEPGETIDPKAQVVVIPFPPVTQGESLRLRIGETYTAPSSYRLENPKAPPAEQELVFDRSLGRPRNAVVIPAGWYVTQSAEPTTLSTLPDGRLRLEFWDDRPEPTDVLLKAKRTRTP